ncbi:MAG: tocopherol cyclase family protein [Calditrichota bacterium]
MSISQANNFSASPKKRFGLTWRPEAFHGYRRSGSFFEGWFIKIVNAAGDRVYSIIPGILQDNDLKIAHSFVQFLDGQSHQSSYFRFSTEQFRSTEEYFYAEVDKNNFHSRGIHLNLRAKETKIQGEIQFGKLIPWPVSLLSPGIMGWYAFTPFMQCYHGVVSMDHSLTGSLTINGEQINFDGGRGYIEKDWGRSFPSSYVWLQCNHFETEGVCLSGSVAKIPWLFSSFRGFIYGLLLDGKLYRFTTYTGATVKELRLSNEHVFITIQDRKYLLEVKADRTDGGMLHAPYENEMIERVSESLSSVAEVKFTERKSGAVIFEEKGKPAALEVHGRLKEIVDKMP